MATTETITLNVTKDQKNTIRQALLARIQEIRKAALRAAQSGNASEASRLQASAQDASILAARFK